MQQTIPQLFFHRAHSMADRVAVCYKVARGPYRRLTWGEFSNQVTEMAFGLAALGLKPGQSCAILSHTAHLWVAADLSILSCGGFSVPLYPTSSLADIEYIINNSEARYVFVGNEQLLNKVLSASQRLPAIKKVIILGAPAGGKSLSELAAPPGLIMGLEELAESGRILMQEKPDLIKERIDETLPSHLATVIYTSGTTGNPKGVMLTHANITGVLDDLTKVLPLSDDDMYLSFLPLSHVFERICGEFYWLTSGGTCAFAEGIEHLGRNMDEICPTVMLVVPRILDRIYAKVIGGIQGATGRARQLIEWSIQIGKEVFRYRQEGRVLRVGLKAKHWFAETLVFRKLRNKIGRNLKFVVSGGAPATGEAIEFFNAIGICTLEGYGLTETAAPVTVNRQTLVKPGTVGSVLPSVQIKLADDGEILIKGPGVFQGYFKNEELTREAIDSDGWFHSGDIGAIDSDGYLTITDRKKDLIINTAGKNIAPQKIEACLQRIPIVAQAIVFGDKRKHLVAVLTLDEAGTVELAREKNWSFQNFEHLSGLPELRENLRKEIQHCMQDLPDYEYVRNFAILPGDLSVEAGELTATLKVRRKVVAEKYKEIVAGLYREEEQARLVNSAR